MQYFTEAIVFSRGVRTRTPILDILGRSRSSVWGIWAFHEESPPVVEQILLSLVHPDHSHACFRLTIRLKNQIGAIAAAASVLTELGVTVLSSICAISGHRHSTWTLLCEDKALALAPPHADRQGRDAFRKECLARTYAAALVAEDALRYVDSRWDSSVPVSPSRSRRLVADYRKLGSRARRPWREPNSDATAGTGRGFLDLRWDLSPHRADGGKLLFGDDATDEIRELVASAGRILGAEPYDGLPDKANQWRFGLRRHAVEISPAPHLIYFAEEHRREGRTAFEFRIDDRDSLLRVSDTDEQAFRRGYGSGGLKGSANSTLSFDAREGAGTVSVLQSKKRFVGAKARFAVDDGSTSALPRILASAAIRKLNLNAVTTSMSGSPPDRSAEVAVEMVGYSELGPKSEAGWQKLTAGIERDIDRAVCGTQRLVRSAARHHNLTVFVSTRFDPGWTKGHGVDIFQRIADVIEEQGLTPVFCLPDTDPAVLVTSLKDHLHARIEEADSLLQILPLLDTEATFEDVRPALGWMVKEFHSATLAGKPVVQLIQVIKGRASRQDWHGMFDPLTSRDRTPLKFKNVADLLDRGLPRAVATLMRKVAR